MDTRPPHKIVPLSEITEDEKHHYIELTEEERAEWIKNREKNLRPLEALRKSLEDGLKGEMDRLRRMGVDPWRKP